MKRKYPHDFVDYFHDLTTGKKRRVPKIYQRNLSIEACYKRYLVRKYRSFFINQYKHVALDEYKKDMFVRNSLGNKYQNSVISKNELMQIVDDLEKPIKILTLNNSIHKYFINLHVGQLTSHEIQDIVYQFIDNHLDLNKMMDIIKNSIVEVISSRLPIFIADKIANYAI